MRTPWLKLRILGVVWEVQASLALAALAVALATAAGLPRTLGVLGLDGEHLALGPLTLGFAVAVGFVLSLGLRAGAHLAVARAFGSRAKDVALSALGESAHLRELPSRALARQAVDATGAMASAALGLACMVGVRLLPAYPPDLRLAAYELAQLNGVLAVLSLLPAARVALQPGAGPHPPGRRTTIAGRTLALALFGVGIWGGAPVLMLAAVYVLAATGADGTEPSNPAQSGLRIREVMVPAPRPLPPEASLDALARALIATHQPALLVGTETQVVGAVGLTRLAEVVPSERSHVRVVEVMAAPLPRLTPSMRVEAAARHMARLRVELLPVFEGDRMVGVVKRELPRATERPVARVPAREPIAVVPSPSVQHCDH